MRFTLLAALTLTPMALPVTMAVATTRKPSS